MNQEVCIIIHGFSGNPWEIKPLANALEQMGYQVITPLLPGHSMNKEKMSKVTALEWIQMIEIVVKKAMAENKKIHLMGFSMGAMIASIIANRQQVSTLVLLSPAVYILTPKLLKLKAERFFQQNRKTFSLSEQSPLNNQSFIRSTPIYNVFQFNKIVRQAKRIFHHISIPICIIHGEKDETVDPRSSELIYSVASSTEKEIHYLPLSKHHICQDCEVQTVIQTVIGFLNKYH
ncbi:alpha/beta hydrolase [Heyndrickxia acidicola]|uniref:Alpha/beta fold hydrolase n=1 Tax=Heyndrickxia acidicola TaxID=209389 RepID=A0ABU6ME25_9BACI|nr:alpha/beta fold hydrolase [Heyndrickxia acidicola]MED1202683.1 alpha/beta fold hydrolase [Heyndrickxia acidicola]